MPLPVINEYIVELAKKIGDQYMAIKNGIGNSSTPGTALFELSQLQSLAINGVPQFGIIGSTSFQASYVYTNPNFISVSGGQVGYNGQIIQVSPQNIPILNNYLDNYDPSYQFGVSIGFPLSEAMNAAKIYATTVSSVANINDTQVLVNNATQFASLGFPINAYIGSTPVLFSGLNSSQTGLLISPSSGGRLTASYSIGTVINFLYSPRIKVLYGQPIGSASYSATNDPISFGYYPKFPNDWLPIAYAIVQYPLSPFVPPQLSNGAPAIVSQVISFPQPSSIPMFSATDAASITQAASSATQVFQSVQNNPAITQSISALQSYTAAIASNPQITFRQYWASSPFYPTTYFGRGVSFEQLERVEFSKSFNQAYYDLNGVDLLHTFALFRGDLYSSGAAEVGPSPTGIVATTLPSSGNPSSITQGSYTYGVSAVYNNGESSPLRATTVATSSNPGFFVNEINFLPVSTPTPLYYNIYLNATSVGNQTEYQITQENILQAGYPWAQKSTPANLENLSNFYNAFKFSASSLTSTTGTISLASLSFSLSATGSITNTSDSIMVTIYTDLNGSPYAPIATGSIGTSILFSGISTTPQTFTSVFSSANLTLGPAPGSSTSSGSSGSSGNSPVYYWAVLSYTNPPLGATIQTESYLTNTRQFLTSSNESVWTSGFDSWVQPVSGTSGLTWTPSVYTTPSQAFPITASNYVGIKFTAGTSISGITTGSIQIGGVQTSFSSTANLTNLATDGLIASLYTDNNGAPETLIVTGSTLYYSNLTTITQPYINQFDATLAIGNNYWIVFTATATPVGGTINIASSNTSSNLYATSTNGETWTVSGYDPWIQPLGFLDNGRTGIFQTSRGIRLTGEIALAPARLSVFVPNITGLTTTPSYTGPAPATGDTTLTKNDMIVTVIAQNGINGVPATFTVTIPQGTAGGTRFPLGTQLQVFDRISSVTVVPGNNLVIGTAGAIVWDVYDFITVETIP